MPSVSMAPSRAGSSELGAIVAIDREVVDRNTLDVDRHAGTEAEHDVAFLPRSSTVSGTTHFVYSGIT
jgi:hypothetical protein